MSRNQKRWIISPTITQISHPNHITNKHLPNQKTETKIKRGTLNARRIASPSSSSSFSFILQRFTPVTGRQNLKNYAVPRASAPSFLAIINSREKNARRAFVTLSRGACAVRSHSRIRRLPRAQLWLMARAEIKHRAYTQLIMRRAGFSRPERTSRVRVIIRPHLLSRIGNALEFALIEAQVSRCVPWLYSRVCVCLIVGIYGNL